MKKGIPVKATHDLEDLLHERISQAQEEHVKSDEHGTEDENESSKIVHDACDSRGWLDPLLLITLVEDIKNRFIELKRESEGEFEGIFQSLKNEFEQLDVDFRGLAYYKDNLEMIVSLAAYTYWEESYGIQQIAVAGLFPSGTLLIKGCRGYSVRN